MKLIFLHGPPASGKYSIAKELEGLLNSSVFHNHLTIDAAKPFFEFGTDDFWKLVHELRAACLKAGFQKSNRIVVYTACYDHPSDLPQFEQIERAAKDAGGEVLPVYLKCEVAELENRVTNPSRVSMGKVRSIEGLRNNLSKWNCVAVPRDNCVTICTDGKDAFECATEIVSVLGLGR